MNNFIDNRKYIEFLEKEIIRLTMENDRKDKAIPMIYEELSSVPYPPMIWQVPRKASMDLEIEAEPFKDAILLSWGDFGQTLFMDSHFKYSMDGMREMCEIFFHKIIQMKMKEIHK